MPLLELPDELIEAIIKNIIFEPLLADFFNPENFNITKLIPFSLACRRLRFLCLPFLAYQLNLSRPSGTGVHVSLDWLANVKYLRCPSKGRRSKIKVYKEKYVIITGECLSFINPRICPMLCVIEMQFSEPQFSVLDHALKIIFNTEYTSRLQIFLKIKSSQLLYLVNKQWALMKITKLKISFDILPIICQKQLYNTVIPSLPFLRSIYISSQKPIPDNGSEQVIQNFVELFYALRKLKRLEDINISIQGITERHNSSLNQTTGLFKGYCWIPETIKKLSISLNLINFPIRTYDNASWKLENLTDLSITLDSNVVDDTEVPSRFEASYMSSWSFQIVQNSKTKLNRVCVIIPDYIFPTEYNFFVFFKMFRGIDLDQLTLSYFRLNSIGNKTLTMLKDTTYMSFRELLIIGREFSPQHNNSLCNIETVKLKEKNILDMFKSQIKLQRCVLVGLGRIDTEHSYICSKSETINHDYDIESVDHVCPKQRRIKIQPREFPFLYEKLIKQSFEGDENSFGGPFEEEEEGDTCGGFLRKILGSNIEGNNRICYEISALREL